jgi:uncharacterized protein (TIGR02444 family)
MTDDAADLWAFALKVYASSGVAAACLDLQDDYGADVPVLLTALWMARRGLRLDPAGMAVIESAVGPWRDGMVTPLRALRRQLKAGPPPAPSPETEALREEIKRAELHAEKIELATLAALVADRFTPSGTADFRENLTVALTHYAGAADVPAARLTPVVAAAEAA